MNTFKVSYVTTLPKEGNAPSVSISGNENIRYFVKFYDVNNATTPILISSGYCVTNQTIIAKTKQWYTKWYIEVYDEMGINVFTDLLNLENKTVFIKMDAYGLGDNIAWIAYVDEFRKKHNCNVVCSTFFNDLFVDAYPNLLFVIPDTVIKNVYAQYYIGASSDDNPYYSPVNVHKVPLQMVASSILGFPYTEMKPDLKPKYSKIRNRFNKKYVTLSEFGSDEKKHWKADKGWQIVVDFLINNGFEVVVISKEPTNLKNVIDLTGNISLNERAIDIYHAEFHLGVSSGLGWLAWGLDTPVVMISDVTPIWHEFNSNILRIAASELDSVNYLAESQTTVEDVLTKLKLLVS